MKTAIFAIILSLFLFPLIAIAQQSDTAASHIFFRRAMSQINQKHVNWIKNSAHRMKEGNLSETEVRNMASQYGAGLSNMDIEALVSLVMMQCAKNAEEDLKALLGEMKKTNEQKKKIRDATSKLNNARKVSVSRAQFDSLSLVLTKRPSRILNKTAVTKPVTVEEIDELVNKMNDEKDSLSEQGELQQLKMQQYMDRMTRADTAASNMLKKFAETASSIIQNLK